MRFHGAMVVGGCVRWIVWVMVMMVMMMVVVVAVVMVMVMVVMLMVMMVVVRVRVKVFGESDFEVHGARSGVYGGDTDCGVFTNRSSLRLLGTDWRSVAWHGGCVFGVDSWC